MPAGPATELVRPSTIVGVFTSAATPPELPTVPQPPADRYRFLAEIGRGGMGVLYRAADTLLGRDVAVKLLRPELAGLPAVERRFLREARVAGRLPHPGVVPVYDAGRFADRRPFLALEFVPGPTLEALLPNHKARRADLLRAAADVCGVLAFAHSRGVVHRDLKPANVILPPQGPARVLDWGLAKLLPGMPAVKSADTDPDFDPASVTLGPIDPGGTWPGGAVGTPAYMPPEQALGGPVDERADVFGLGGLLLAALTGKPPHAAASGPEVWTAARTCDTEGALARLAGSGASRAMADLVARCLSADPADRPRDAREVAAALAFVR